MPFVLRCILAACSGVLATLSFAPFDIKPLAFIAFAALFYLVQAQNLKRAWWLAILFGWSHFASGIYWVYISTHIYGGAPWWLGATLGFFLFLVLSLFLASGVIIALLLQRRFPQQGYWLAAALGFTSTEILRGVLFSGFPWLTLGNIATDTPLANLLVIAGAHAVSFIVVAIAVAALQIIQNKGRDFAALATIISLLLLIFIAPNTTRWTQAINTPLSVAIIQGQGEVLMNQKWRPENRELLFSRFREMTLAAAGNDLIVWPESPLPATLAQLTPYYFPDLDQAMKERNSALFVGVLAEGPNRAMYNRVTLLGNASGYYDKRHLVPFGEYFPIPAWLRPIMDVLGTPYSDFTPGVAKQELLEAKGHKIYASICFEDVFGNEFRQNAFGASVLLNLTNDSWFGAGSAPHQHLQIARIRAIENGRELVRATNSGFSAFIAADGTVRGKSGLYVAELVQGQIQARSGVTPYARFGDALIWTVLGVATALGLLLGRFLRQRTFT